MRSTAFLLPLLAAVTSCSSAPAPAPADPATVEAGHKAFAHLVEVLRHPRCLNCHPDDDRPRQGMHQAVHDPPVWRGPDDRGEPGAHCASCHQDRNATDARVPGAPGWHLAPLSMAWRGRSDAAICAQLKDKARNGGRTLDELQQHLAEDPLVGWGFSPGHGREPAPGSQAALGDTARTWIDAGAPCPPRGEPQ